MEPNPDQSTIHSENPVVTQPTSTVTTSKKSSMPMILGILLLLLLVGAGAYYLGRQNTSETMRVVPTITRQSTISQSKPIDSWQTFISAPSFYSVKYPANWYTHQYAPSQLADSGEVVQTQEFTDIPFSQKPDAGGTYTRVQIYTDSGVMPTSFPYTNGINENKTIKSITLNTYEGIRGFMTSTQGLTEAVYLKNPKGGHVKIIFYNTGSNPSEGKALFEQMLSTFKFTDQKSQTISTPTPSYKSPLTADAGHKLYVNSTYRFSFLYPTDFVINSSSTSERVSFLQKQDTLMAQRLLVTVYANASATSLKDFALAHTPATESQAVVGQSLRGYEMVSITKDLSNSNCNDGRALTQRTQSTYLRSGKTIVELASNDSCETQGTDWFSPIISSLFF